MKAAKIIRGVRHIYGRIPGVPCIPGCKGCCVSPNMTLAEFIVMMTFITENLPEDAIRQLVIKPMASHPGFEGNYFCRFQGENGLCLIHGGRAMACRLHGLPAIEQLGVSNLENCTKMKKGSLPVLETNEVRSWLNQLMDINKEILDDYGETVYQVIGLNVECWLDVLFQKNESNELMEEFHELMKQFIPLDKLKFPYETHTEIAEKFEKIALLDICIKMGDTHSARNILNKILSGFPSTGNYFHNSAAWLLGEIQKKENSNAAKN